jgi:hypothetical protein
VVVVVVLGMLLVQQTLTDKQGVRVVVVLRITLFHKSELLELVRPTRDLPVVLVLHLAMDVAVAVELVP